MLDFSSERIFSYIEQVNIPQIQMMDAKTIEMKSIQMDNRLILEL